jgi:hypothetical protein
VSEAIPIIDSRTGEQEGTITVGANGIAHFAGPITKRWGESSVVDFDVSEESASHFFPPPPLLVYTPPTHTPWPQLPKPTPEQMASARALFSEDVLRAEWMEAAAAKGRKVHDDALALMEETGIGYKAAIKRVLEDR